MIRSSVLSRIQAGLSFLPLRSLMAVTRSGRQVGRTGTRKGTVLPSPPQLDGRYARRPPSWTTDVLSLLPFKGLHVFPSVARVRRCRGRTRADASPKVLLADAPEFARDENGTRVPRAPS